jgi:AcrR family transcriptional regulator
MIAAAVTLFARSGFNGVTTKEIAQCANVSDGNIFRYFPTKRDLFLSAFESELNKLSNSVEDLALITNAKDSQTALRAVFELVAGAMVKQPELVRLLHFSALEFKSDIDRIFQQHVYPICEALAQHRRERSCTNDSRDINPMTTVLFFIATIILLRDFFPSSSGCPLPFESDECGATFVDLWCQVVSTLPTADPLTVSVAAGVTA